MLGPQLQRTTTLQKGPDNEQKLPKHIRDTAENTTRKRARQRPREKSYRGGDPKHGTESDARIV